MPEAPSRCALLAFISIQVFSGSNGATPQETVDYMATHLQVEYKVEDNFQLDTDPKDFTPHAILLTNSGNTAIGGDPWAIYFCKILPLYGTFDAFPGGAPLGHSGLLAYHINGCLYRISPDREFGIQAGHSVVVTIYSKWSQVSKTDIMPNWYIAMEGAAPKTLSSTAGESLDFVADFTEANQYKRSRADRYEPYTPQYRYDLNKDVDDLHSAQHFVIPTPVEEDMVAGEDMTVDNTWSVYAGSSALANEARFLADRLDLATDTSPPTNVIELAIAHVTNSDGDTVANQESYKLTTTQHTISIIGPTPAGIFWGIQSLLSLCESTPCTIPVGEIIDYPRFPYRGMHLDVSRNFFPVDDVKRLLEVMSRYKLNKFHFHLSDDEGWRVEIGGLEELTQVGAHRCHDEEQVSCIIPQLGSGPDVTTSGSGFYSMADYRDILSYANERHVQVIPEFDMPGHAHAAIKAMEFRYRKYSAQGDEEEALKYLLSDSKNNASYHSIQDFTDGAINPCMDSTYRFVLKVVQELKKLHEDVQPLKVFHFGGDEVPAGAWENSPICQQLEGKERLQAKNSKDLIMKNFVTRVADIIASEGLDMGGWEDGLIGGGEPYNISELAEGTTYYGNAWSNTWEWGGGHQAYMLANAGYKTIISHTTHFYFDHPYEPDPEERGYYWATRYTDTRKTFGYIMGDVYQNIDEDRMGSKLKRDEICNTHRCDQLEEVNNVIGVQGQLWSETVRTGSQLDYMIFPRLLALAERAWHRPAWEDEKEGDNRKKGTRDDWERFSNTLGHRDLGRLDALGVKYAVPSPGATVSNEATLRANTAYPGLPIKFSEDGGRTWQDYSGTHQVSHDVLLKTMSHDGTRASRIVHVTLSKSETSPTGTGSELIWSCSIFLFVLSLRLLYGI